MRKRWASAVLAIVALVGVSACGSPSSEPNSAAPTTGASAGVGTSNSSAPTTVPSRSTTTTAQGGQIEGTEISQLPQVPVSSAAVDVDPRDGQALATFLTSTFNDIQSMWAEEFKKANLTYVPATLQLYSGSVQTACGSQGAEVGPFYCPGDRTVYLDQTFFVSMEDQFGLKGDFGLAYVVAHEMGHHIQALLGITTQVGQLDQLDPPGTNSRSVLVELQADCLAGVWAHSTDQRNLRRDGDLAVALKAAAAVGDDFIARLAGKPAEPDNFTHGTSAQRQQWLTTGFESGNPDACDTFASTR